MRYAESLNSALHGLMAEDKRVFILGEDVIDPYGGAFKITKGLSTAYPDRVITTPISEAGITGIAVGMAMRGLRPILEIMFGDFITLCADQIINSAAKFSWMYNGKTNVPFVVRTPMGGRRGYGPTHSQTLETLFLNVPGLTIIAPSHFHDPGNLLRSAALKENNPVLFIENKFLYPQTLAQPGSNGRVGNFFVKVIQKYNKDYPTLSLMPVENEKPQISLVAYGGMASLAAEAAFNLFMRDEIITEVILPSLIKPIPLPDIIESIKISRRLIIAEESVCTAGWGAEVGCQVYENIFKTLITPIRRIGAKEFPIASSRMLEEEILPQVTEIEKAIRQEIGK